MSGFIFLVAVFVVAIMLLAVVSGGKKRGGRGRGTGRQSSRSRNDLPVINVGERWASVKAIAATGPGGLKQAIVDGDKLLDYALKQQGYPGETLGERLKAASPHLRSRDQAWQAHKLRNALAHEIGFDLVPSQAREALDNFEITLRELGAL